MVYNSFLNETMNKIRLRLYKHRFSDNWKVIVAAKDINSKKMKDSGISVFYLSPSLQYWTKCLKIIDIEESKAEYLFRHYLDKGSFDISNVILSLGVGLQKQNDNSMTGRKASRIVKQIFAHTPSDKVRDT